MFCTILRRQALLGASAYPARKEAWEQCRRFGAFDTVRPGPRDRRCQNCARNDISPFSHRGYEFWETGSGKQSATPLLVLSVENAGKPLSATHAARETFGCLERTDVVVGWNRYKGNWWKRSVVGGYVKVWVARETKRIGLG